MLRVPGPGMGTPLIRVRVVRQTGSTELGWLGANRLSFPASGAGASAFLVLRCSATRAVILTLTVRGHHVETRG